MKVLYLGKPVRLIQQALRNEGDAYMLWQDPLDRAFVDQEKFDFAVSYGYRHIVKPEVLEYFGNRIVNLHISLLPWNRGSDPNLWSFLEATPVGISLHVMDHGLDTGPMIAQEEVEFDLNADTLATTYDRLSWRIESLFARRWPKVRTGAFSAKPQMGAGSFHKKSEKQPFLSLLTDGWNTRIKEVYGAAKKKRT